MKVKNGFIYLAITAGLFLSSCKAGKETSPRSSNDVPVISTKPMVKGGQDVQFIPNATVFRMNGNYADNVAITLNQDGELAYYPDPTDLAVSSSPFPLENGWYLNRQGIGADSKFTSYTFEEYRSLNSPPTHDQLTGAIIQGATITEFIELPVRLSEALADPQICLQYLPE